VGSSDGNTLAAKADAKEQPVGAAPSYKFRLQKAKAREFDGGSIREHRAADFPASHNISAGVVRLMTGAYREPHWHPRSDEWAYILEGKVRLTVVGPHGATTVEDFDYGDAWFVPIGFGHPLLNIGDTKAQVLLVHNNGDFSTIELSEGAAGGPKDVITSTLGAPEQALDQVPKKKLFLAR
jgi:oxalate decarboxylase